jgi:hypothetical protein
MKFEWAELGDENANKDPRAMWPADKNFSGIFSDYNFRVSDDCFGKPMEELLAYFEENFDLSRGLEGNKTIINWMIDGSDLGGFYSIMVLNY